MIKKIPEETWRFHFHNANPKNNKTGDCVIRAISTASNTLDWTETLTALYNIAVKYKLSPTDKKCYIRLIENLGGTKYKQPRRWDNRKYTGEEFCELLDNAGYGNKPVIAHIGGHHIVCIKPHEGHYKIWDTWDSSDGCVGNYWVMGN